MLLKTATSLAFATACLTAIASTPGHAQTIGAGSAPGAYAPQAYQGNQTYQGNMAPGGYQGNMSSQGMSAPGTGMGSTEVVTNGPQGSPPPDWSARQNVIESHRYDRLLETNRGFREARMRKECGPITDPQLHQQCLASFGQDEPYMGSSTSHRAYRSNAGR